MKTVSKLTLQEILNPTKEQFQAADKELKDLERIESKWGLSEKGIERQGLLQAIVANYIGNNRGIN